MEQPDSCKYHRHAVPVACLDYSIVTHGAAGLNDILNAALLCTVNVIGEGEERVAAKRHILHPIQPCPALFSRKYRRFHLKGLLPDSVRQHIHIIIAHIHVNGIVTVRAAQLIHKLQPQHLGGLAQEPVVRLASGQAGAVNPGLLPRADADSLSVLYIAYGCLLYTSKPEMYLGSLQAAAQ